MKPKVTIFLWVSTKAPKTKAATYKYIMNCRGHQISGKGMESNITGHRLVMKALIAALKRMRQPAELDIRTDCNYLINGHKFMDEWIRNEWKKSDGKEVKNADLWQMIYQLEEQHTIECNFENIIPELGE